MSGSFSLLRRRISALKPTISSSGGAVIPFGVSAMPRSLSLLVRRISVLVFSGGGGATVPLRRYSQSTSLPRKQQRVRDHSFDRIMDAHKKVRRFLALRDLLLAHAPNPTSPSLPFARLAALAGRHASLSTIDCGRFLLRHPHVFHLFVHPVRRVLSVRLTPRAADQLRRESDAIAAAASAATVVRLQKLLLLSAPRYRLRLEHIRIIRRDLGLPDDFEHSVVLANPAVFRLITKPDDDSPRSKYVELIVLPGTDAFDSTLIIPAVTRARELHYRTQGSNAEDARFGFPCRFPPGFKIGKYFRIAMWKWQRLPYWSPYEDVTGHDLRSPESQRRMEKRGVAMIHELLSITVEKRTTQERIAQFRGALGLPKKLKEFLLQYQGIFYVSTRGNQGKLHTVFLREAYYKGELVEPNEIHLARRDLQETLLLSPEKANVDRMLTSLGRGFDELSGGHYSVAEFKQEMVRRGREDGNDDSGSDSGVESLYID